MKFLIPLPVLALSLLGGCASTPVTNLSNTSRPAVLEKSFAKQNLTDWDLAFPCEAASDGRLRDFPAIAKLKLNPGPQKVLVQYYGFRGVQTLAAPHWSNTLRMLGPVQVSAQFRPSERCQVRCIPSDADVIFLIADVDTGDILAHTRPIPFLAKGIESGDPELPLITKIGRRRQ